MSERGDAIADRGFRWLVTGTAISIAINAVTTVP